MEYEFDADKIKKEIRRSKAKTVLLQLPDGLKPEYEKIIKKLEGEGYELFLWGGSCYGACDTPNVPKIDLIIQLGHEEMK